MYYLKCQNCGLLNEVKTEYQVFCTGCNKKLANNFREWQSHYSEEATFEDFKRLVCVTGSEFPSEPVKVKKTEKRGAKFWIVFTISFAIFSVIGRLAGEKIYEFFQSEPAKVNENILNQEWVRDTYGDYGLSLQTPQKLEKGELEIPDNIKELIANNNTFNYQDNSFQIMVNSIEYKAVVGEANLQMGADGAMNSVKSQKGVTDFRYEERNLFVSNIHGLEQKGNCKIKNSGVEFINNIFVKGLKVWQVLVIYRVDDDIARTAARKVIGSIDIKN
jgi:hypothetical protein